jgi:polyribonucleotide nucleotidyltransferase
MATVCGGTLAMLDAGVAITSPVAGIAMGLVKEGSRVVILSDILGDEDHSGDMDFKVTGTADGITALQMDIKIDGVSREILASALDQARRGRLHILDEMKKAIDRPRDDYSPHAPRLLAIRINPEKIGTIIGPGGKMIRQIQEETGTTVEVEDDGTVKVFSTEGDGAKRAIQWIEDLTLEAEVGKVYEGKVVQMRDFGVFVQILPNQDGMVHVSELSDGYVDRPSLVRDVGDQHAAVGAFEEGRGIAELGLVAFQRIAFHGILGPEAEVHIADHGLEKILVDIPLAHDIASCE